ncbi:MAG: glycoside hydrolase family 3 protein [Lachnospiraceae bacterium]|nr:glycoside hydrolase family 3 protein [Lachnospiraceae bacterium]
MKKNIWKRLTPLFALLLTSAIGSSLLLWQYDGMVDEALGVKHTNVTVGGETVFASRYGDINSTNQTAMLADLRAHNVQTQEEGSVLLKNNGILPLDSSVKMITLLGRASVDPVYRYTSGGPGFNDDGVSLRDALENAGFTINETVASAYGTSKKTRDKFSGDIGEEGEAFFTDAIVKSFTEYNDLAIVLFSRYGGEGTDLMRKDVDGVSQLSLHESEKAVLRMARAHFSRVLLLVNSGNPIELGWMDREDYGVDACLWIGTPGSYGFEGVVHLLTGQANPSGALIDTYAVDSLSAPATQNFGDYTYSNAGEFGLTSVGVHDVTDKYLVESEGIYVGYRYYETRYEDLVRNRFQANSQAGSFASQGAWNYAEEVAFPFGYGLSYTTFSREITGFSDAGESGEEFTLEVTVKNTGDIAGKTPVQIYVQVPYTEYDRENLVEKSAVQLVGFGKTKLLAPGEEETVTVRVDKYLLASYDSHAHDQKGGYTLEAGSYFFATGNGAHEALNNILAKQNIDGLYDHNGMPVQGEPSAACVWTLEQTDDSTYLTMGGSIVENRMADADINTWIPGAVTYLTRQDWNTFPKELTSLSATAAMAEVLNLSTNGEGSYEMYTRPSDGPGIDAYTQGADVTLLLTDMKGVPFEDEKWDAFIDQMTILQMTTMTSDMGGLKAVKDIGFPAVSQNDGPDGAGGVQYVGQSVAAAAFNPSLMADRGDFFAEEALFSGRVAVWSPGADIHRTPFGGRNFEYYSEDSYYSYLCAGLEVGAMQKKGLVSSIKHFAGNDQEMNRYGVCTFTTEQAWRQGPLRGFEGAFTKGGGLSTMTSYSRYGLVLTCENDVVNNQILRGEWGFKGFTITDAGSGTPLDSLAGGTDEFCMNDNAKAIYQWITRNDDGTMLGHLRQANKRIFYSYVNSNLANRLSYDMVIDDGLSWWQYAVIALDILLGVLTVAGLVLYGRSLKKGKEN